MTRLRGLTRSGVRRVADLLKVTNPNSPYRPTPVDPSASAAATNLLNRMYQYRGAYTLAGQQQGDDGSDQDSLVQAHNGNVRPAIRGYDSFIGDLTSGNATTQLTQIISDWSGAKVIPTISQHWTPAGSGEVAPGDATLDDPVSLTDIFNTGTTVGARYATFKTNLGDDLATLAASGVPVLLRPWHEAGGVWFWWSQGTGAQYCALWVDLYNYITVTRGIHNCLWVWSAGWATVGSDWYPGDQYVDVVTVDDYDTTTGDYTSDYQTLGTYGDGEKLRAMGEAGWVPAMTTFGTAPLAWSLMWTGSFLTQNSDAAITAYYADRRTVNRSTVAAFINGTLPMVVRNPAVALGDSNTANPSGTVVESGPGGEQTASWFVELCHQSRQRITHAGVFAHAGYTVAQVRDDKLAAVLAATPIPGACFVMLGTNDIISGTNGSGFSLTTAANAYIDIITGLQAAGILPIIVIPIPASSTAGTIQANHTAWRAKLRELAGTYGCPIVDAYTPLKDGTTNIQTAYAQDTFHVNPLGRRVIATALLAQGIANYFPPTPTVTAKTSTDITNAVPSGYGLYLTTSGWGSFGDTSHATIAQVVPVESDGLAGNWHQITHNGSSLFNRQMADTAVTWATGDKILFTGRVRSSGVEAAKTSGLTPSYFARVALLNSGGTTLAYILGMLVASEYDVDIPDGMIYARGSVPAGTTAFRIELQSSGFSASFPLTVKYGELTVRNLTS
jgi:lysophospholipase L1-like esterase